MIDKMIKEMIKSMFLKYEIIPQLKFNIMKLSEKKI